jgi:transcriptional regulator with XRE-family HTH domain
MPRPEVAPPRLPDVPFLALDPAHQARCIGWNLRIERKRAGYSTPAFVAHMRQLTPAAAVSLSYLGDIERGDRTPSITTVLALAQALGIDPCSLFAVPAAGLPADLDAAAAA